MTTIEERALELYPVEIKEEIDIDSYQVLYTYDANETRRVLYIKWHKEQEAITKKEMIEKAKRWAEEQNFSVTVQLDLIKYLED